jgi:hypothetical protein
MEVDVFWVYILVLSIIFSPYFVLSFSQGTSFNSRLCDQPTNCLRDVLGHDYEALVEDTEPGLLNGDCYRNCL